MRGKGCDTFQRGAGGRITPAYAGKRVCCISRPRLRRDHPRVCGEKGSWRHIEHQTQGSPPRMRGKVHAPSRCSLLSRITPAYAGKRRCGRCAGGVPWDHPRVCGEKDCGQFILDEPKGSPPRMRGKALPVFLPISDSGITPAYAGKSSRTLSVGQM